MDSRFRYGFFTALAAVSFILSLTGLTVVFNDTPRDISMLAVIAGLFNFALAVSNKIDAEGDIK